MIIVGHRGFGSSYPENTLLSFQKAIEYGCKVIEMDVRLSKDKELVVIHDDSVDRTTNGKGLVEKMLLEDIKRLYCKDDQKIPTLDEAISACKRRINLCIELKVKGTENKTIELIRSNRIKSRTMIISYDPEILKTIKSLDKNVKIGLLFDQYSPNVWHYAKSIPLDIICPGAEILTEDIIKEAKKHRDKLYVFDVKNKETADKLVSLGVEYIGTDYPELFLQNKHI